MPEDFLDPIFLTFPEIHFGNMKKFVDDIQDTILVIRNGHKKGKELSDAIAKVEESQDTVFKMFESMGLHVASVQVAKFDKTGKIISREIIKNEKDVNV